MKLGSFAFYNNAGDLATGIFFDAKVSKGMVRFSFSYFNTIEEVDRGIYAIDEIIKPYKW